MELILTLFGGLLAAAVIALIREARQARADRQATAVAAAKAFADYRSMTLPSIKPWDELRPEEQARLIRIHGGKA